MKKAWQLVAMGGWLALLWGCTTTAVAGSVCSSDNECGEGELCVSGECFDSRNSGATACSLDTDCSDGQVCGSAGVCEVEGSGQSCTVTTDCSIDQFCNTTLPSAICTPLQNGACREETQCGGLLCSATTGGVGRCVECQRGADCSSGRCNPDGTCDTSGGGGGGGGGNDAGVPDSASGGGGGSSSCVPDCNTGAGEQCVSGVCYGANGCPLNGHPEGGGCACDDGYQPNSIGTACEVASGGGGGGGGNDGGGGGSDVCGGTCTPDETCYQGSCYGANGCPRNAHPDGNYCTCDDGFVPNAQGNGCEAAGAGSCPANAHPANGGCACDDGYQPNTQGTACEPIGGGGGGSGDVCADNNLYGNGTCDSFCPQPDPDCSGGGGGGGGATCGTMTCTADESCYQDICYGADGCPRNAGPDGSGNCVCDAGFVLNAAGNACEPDGGGGGGGGGTGDPCADNGWYGDGECDTFCPQPDPDCGATGGGSGGGGGGGGGGTGDFCADNGWYGDGVCDDFCPSPDPDCSGGGGGTGDYCADYGWYNDGYCDDCPTPDPDCAGPGSGGGGGYNTCTSDWDCWAGEYCDLWSGTCVSF